MNEFEKFTCSLTTSDGVEIGSGVIVQIDLGELLQHPSCLEKKVYGELPAVQQPCYALITAHSNVYEEGRESETPEPSVIECLGRSRKVMVVKSNELKTIDDSCVSCRAVSCCGIDSMLRMPQPSHDQTQRPRERPTHHTLKSHGRGKCNIGCDFVVVFLKSDVFCRWFPEKSHLVHPPRLSLAQCSQLPNTLHDKFEVYMCWRGDKGSVVREKVGINISHLESRPQLGDEISYFEAYQSLKYSQQDGEGAPSIHSHVGAPIVLRNTRTGTSHLIGINTGEGVTTFYGIFKLLKGGVVPFLAAMTHPTANARSLKPSRWKDYLLPHVDPHMQTLHTTLRDQYVVDLLHYLLKRIAGVTIVKLLPSDNSDNVVAGLNVLTETLNKLKKVQGYDQCCSGIKCFRDFCSTDLHNCLQRYAQHPENPHYKDMVEAIFEFFEALLTYREVAKEALQMNIELLIKIATHEHYESNNVVNRCCKNILVRQYEYLKAELKERQKPDPDTQDHSEGELVVSTL